MPNTAQAVSALPVHEPVAARAARAAEIAARHAAEVDAASRFPQEAMDAAVQSLADASDQVTNEDVAAILPDLQAMFGQVADLMSAIVEGDTSKVGELQDLGAGFQETGARFEELCAPAE